MRRTAWLGALMVGVLCMLAAAVAAAGAGARTTVLPGTVTRVVDGDTVHVRVRGFDTVVRLIGIDTPETVHPSKPVQCWGPQASARAKRLMPVGARVRVVSDPTQDARDRYGRFLGYVYTGSRSGAASVNRALVAAGAAKVYIYAGTPFRHARAFSKAQTAARRAKNGLWGPPCNGAIDRPAARATPTPAPSPRSGCDPNYAGACVPVTSRDLDCDDIRREVRVIGTDRHRFDSDGNGWGCEAYG